MRALLASIVLSHYISRGKKSKESLPEKRRSRKKFPVDHFKKNPTHEFEEKVARNVRMPM
jgi:hypothetical protein